MNPLIMNNSFVSLFRLRISSRITSILFCADFSITRSRAVCRLTSASVTFYESLSISIPTPSNTSGILRIDSWHFRLRDLSSRDTTPYNSFDSGRSLWNQWRYPFSLQFGGKQIHELLFTHGQCLIHKALQFLILILCAHFSTVTDNR